MEDKTVGYTSGILPAQVGKVGVLPWRELRDRIAPQGTAVRAEDMVDRTFTILRYRPYQSSFEGGRETVYWVVVVTDDGELFNFTLGGVSVCDVLDAMHRIKVEYEAAKQAGDRLKMSELEELGANRPWQFTLRWMKGGQGAGYYIFE